MLTGPTHRTPADHAQATRSPTHSHPIRADPRHLPRKTLYPRLGPDLAGTGPPGPLPCTSVPFLLNNSYTPLKTHAQHHLLCEAPRTSHDLQAGASPGNEGAA